ncbi:hypothetical protein CPJCM30710_12560 [Clostridium polyendosporum]|uniref:Uncharacterized protein n=1 Tax=Clostridium polyendosporum TaxID=69208 RepID=A0A919VFN0_9CLOT|nr:hypothetical protein [Clostridium polyendosporum]GIM28590.1 hypothetical protein CPJCM30710_12560 [Clostridium polyendosporum]
MLKLSILEFLFRLIPEGFLFILASYTLSKNLIDKKRYLISSIILAIIVYSIRSLPIHYGVHTILVLIIHIVLTVNINKIDIIKSIESGITTIIIEFICEGINVFLIHKVFKVDIDVIFSQPLLKIIYGIPSLLMLGCIIVLWYIRLLKKKELRKCL